MTLTLEGVTVDVVAGRGRTRIVEDVSLSLPPRTTTCLVGESDRKSVV